VIARVLRVEVSPERIDAVVDAYREHVRPIHAQASGLRQHYVFTDHEIGRIEIAGIWDSAEAAAAVGPTLEPARQRLWSEFGMSPPLEIYEVADELR
jgi:hypothetical protein